MSYLGCAGLNPLLVWILQCSANVCYAKLVVYTLARILNTRCRHADLVLQVAGGTEGQHWLPTSNSEGCQAS